MIIEYDANLVPFHRVNQYDSAFVASLAARDNWVEIADSVPSDGTVVLELSAADVVQAFHVPEDGGPRRELTLKAKLRAFAISAPTEMRVGVEARFSGVPAGTAISVNGQPVDVMDASGAYDLEAGTVGRYVVGFSLAGYATREWTFEATA